MMMPPAAACCWCLRLVVVVVVVLVVPAAACDLLRRRRSARRAPFAARFLSWHCAHATATCPAINTQLQTHTRPHTYSQADVDLHLPIAVGDYTDFYASRHHAYNCGVLFRDAAEALPRNWCGSEGSGAGQWRRAGWRFCVPSSSSPQPTVSLPRWPFSLTLTLNASRRRRRRRRR